MKVELSFKILTREIIDLTDYGYDESITFESLTDDQQNEITDSFRESIIPDVYFRDLKD